MPDGTWLAGKVGDKRPVKGAIWRGYAYCAERILTLYGEKWAGRTKIASLLQEEGWAWRDRDGNPTAFETDDVRRVTNNWPEYGGAVLGERARERNPLDYDPDKIVLSPERAVFDVAMLLKVGRAQKERTRRAPDRGHARTDFPYPLSGQTYCARCEFLARQEKNPRLRSRLGGKSQSRYRHKPGASCGCMRKSVSRDVYEGDFLRLLQLLTVKPEMLELMTKLAIEAKAINPKDDRDFETKREAAIAKYQRRIEAARHLYEDGDLSRQEYMRRREHNEREIIHWQTYSTETKKLAVEFAMCVDMVDKIVRLWETGTDEDKQGMVRHLFDHIVYDLDQQRIVDFQLKPWANRFLILRHALYGGESGDGQAAEEDKKGTKGSSSPVGVTKADLK